MSKKEDRRDFIKKIGLSGLAVANIPFVASAESFLNDSVDSKNIAKKLVFKSRERNFNEKYERDFLNRIAFPLGGIGAGMVCLEGTGAISHVSINNKPDIFNEPYIFSALHIKNVKNGTKVLEGQVPEWKLFGQRGAANGLGEKTYGLPRFKECSFLARFPFGIVELKDDEMPVSVTIKGWSPFIPTDEDNSSLPCTVLEYTFKNTSSKKTEAVFSYNSKNFFDTNGRIQKIQNGFKLAKARDARSGFAVYVDDGNAIVDYCWFRGGWFDAQSILWRNIESGKMVNNAPISEIAPGASIYVPFSLSPGQKKIINVHLVWYNPYSDVSFGIQPKSVGQAFNKPSKGTVPHQQQVDGFIGKGLLNSFDPGGDAQTGILHSPEINLSKQYMKFLIGGGNDPDKTSVNLVVNDKIVRTAAGAQSEILNEAVWDISEFMGQKGYIKIIDLSTESWGHVLADQFVLTDNKNEDLKNLSQNTILIEDFEGETLGKWHVFEDKSQENNCCSTGFCDCTYKPWYAGRFKSINELIAYWNKNYIALRKNTELFSNAFYTSTLPAEVLEAIGANLTILKSPTVLRQTDGRLWAYEGCYDDSGCCHGNCTHVWNYAQALPHLFPMLEKTLRETEFEISQNNTGHQNFRSNLPISPTSHNFHAAADGQLGGVLKIYRDWRINGNINWLKNLYPQIKKSIDYCIRTWDPMHRGFLEEPHHNTYDIEFWGPDGMCTSIYLGALSAMIKMCEAIGKPFNEYQILLDKGKKYLENELFDGEYFIQKIKWQGLQAKDPTLIPSYGGYYSKEAKDILVKEGPKYQYGKGCLSDGIIGMWMSKVCGLDEVVDEKKIGSHLLSVHKYNLRQNLEDHSNPQRPTYAVGIDGGLLLCTWPKGGKLSLPFVYSNEVWTGIEYQVASHLIFHGKVEEGLDIVRECRKRYNGTVRNPFDEYECGHWYARAMASYALLQSLTGLRYDAVDKTLYIDSKIGDFTCFISAATGFGTVFFKKNTNPVLKVLYGKIVVENYNIGGKIIKSQI